MELGRRVSRDDGLNRSSCNSPMLSKVNSRVEMMNNSSISQLQVSKASSPNVLVRTPATIVKVVRSPSPAQNIFINNKLVSPSGGKTAPGQLFPADVKNRESEGKSRTPTVLSNGINSNVGTELVIQELNTMENLKDSYGC